MENKKRDLIDRGQIQYTWWELPDGKFTDGVTLQSLIHLMPAVDAVEVVHGRWEDTYGGKYANPRYRCSVCKAKSLYKLERDCLASWKEVQAFTPYCPNCGAKMDGDNT